MRKKEKLNVLFVDPATKANMNIPNIGMAYAAAYYNTKVIDQHILPVPRNRFLKYETDVLGISVKSITRQESGNIADVYKNKYPQSKVKSVSGFIEVQCCYPYLEFEDKIVYEKPFSDELPFPKYELFDSFNYMKINWQVGLWHYPIITSQGCPYSCIFCASGKKKWEHRSAENCFRELKGAKEKYDIKSFEILDDCFNFNEDRVLEFCRLVKSLKLKWFCSNGVRADHFNEKMAQVMFDSGCRAVGFGIETTNPEVFENIKKGETIEQIEKAVNIAKKYFKLVHGFFIIGLPGATFESDYESLRWAKEKNIDAHFSYFLPFDRQGQYNELFYGTTSKPISNAYDKEKQREIYTLARKTIRRSAVLRKKLWGKMLLSTLKVIAICDIKAILTHFFVGPAKLFFLITRGETG